MTRVVPAAFLFRYALPVAKADRLSPKAIATWQLPESLAIPAELDAASRFADVRLAWNEKGIALAVVVNGKTAAPQCDPAVPTESDGVQVWIDTRDTQSIHRAGRFCHHFCVLPSGGGNRKQDPIAIAVPIARAREDAPLVESPAIPVFAELSQTGYRLHAWFAAEVLNGFDPEATPRLGFYYAVRDSELGTQTLTVGDEFPYAHDPSVWSTLELTSR